MAKTPTRPRASKTVRFSESELALIERAAELLTVDVTTYIRRAALIVARDELEADASRKGKRRGRKD